MKTNLTVRPPLPELPQEVILHVVSHLEGVRSPAHGFDPQRSLWAACLLSRNWYSATIEALYRYPRLTSRNYDAFVDTVCPSINAHVKKTDLAGMVRVLDLSQLVFAGTRSFIARLLRRLKDNLETLKAPQTSFGVASLAALSKCTSLRVLDLSLVTESIPILDFFRVIEKLDTLQNLHLPRASLAQPKEGPGTRALAYPRALKHLVIPGRICRILSAYAPESELQIESLHLQEVPLDYWDLAFLNKVSSALVTLTIREPINRSTRFEQGVWDATLNHFAGLKSLRLEHFSSLYHLLSTSEGLEFELPAALESLEELVLGPVPIGANMLRFANRPFDITDTSDDPELDLLDFIAALPRFQRLILSVQAQPSIILQDILSDYLSLSRSLRERYRSQTGSADNDSAHCNCLQAGVFWTLQGPATDITDPHQTSIMLHPLESELRKSTGLG